MFLDLLTISANKDRLVFIESVLQVTDAVETGICYAEPFDLDCGSEMSHRTTITA